MGLSLAQYRNIIDLSPYPRPEPFETDQDAECACGELLKFLLRETGMIAAFSVSYEKKRALVRSYMNRRSAFPVPQEILALQDRYLWTETLRRGIVKTEGLSENKYGFSLWEGDITRLNADVIVNAANKSLLGCFLPGHNCIDNVIHSCAGMQLRRDCARIMAAQEREEECGEAKATRAYNLPSTYVFHTVGPMIVQEVKEEHHAQLRSCYINCLNLAKEMNLSSVAFCCISTGVFNFPRSAAAEIAAGTVLNWKLRNPESNIKVIFNTFLKEDTDIYERILSLM